MGKEPRGLYWTRGVGGLSNAAHVTDGTLSFDIPEARYRHNGYKPSFDDLPWKEDYDPAKNMGTGNG
jgi:hypothetical protein